MGTRDFNAAITVMPDGNVYAGGEDKGPANPLYAKKIASLKLNAKDRSYEDTFLNKPLSAALKAVKYNNGMIALHAAEGVANSENLTHLQLVRLFPQVQGVPDDYFYLEEGFVKRDIPNLEFREPFYDTVATAQYLARLEQSRATKTKYDEIKYDLKKLVDKVYTPIEDIYRTIINPQEVDLSQVRWGFGWKRNQSALTAIQAIGNNQGTLGKFELIGAGELHSTNRAAKELNEEFNAFLKANDIRITHVIMNTKLFTEYSENTWTKSGPLIIDPMRTQGGVFPLPGIAGVTAIVDVAVPDNKIFAINKPNALRLGEGPKIMRRYYDEERDASAIKMIDFHEHIAVNKQITKLSRKFGMTLDVTA